MEAAREPEGQRARGSGEPQGLRARGSCTGRSIRYAVLACAEIYAHLALSEAKCRGRRDIHLLLRTRILGTFDRSQCSEEGGEEGAVTVCAVESLLVQAARWDGANVSTRAAH